MILKFCFVKNFIFFIKNYIYIKINVGMAAIIIDSDVYLTNE